VRESISLNFIKLKNIGLIKLRGDLVKFE